MRVERFVGVAVIIGLIASLIVVVEVLETAQKIGDAACVASGNPTCIVNLADALAESFAQTINGTASRAPCTAVDLASREVNDLPADSDFDTSLKHYAGDNPRRAAKFAYDAAIQTDFGQKPNLPGRFGDFNLPAGASGFELLTPEMAAQIPVAMVFLRPKLDDEGEIAPDIWMTDPAYAINWSVMRAHGLDLDAFAQGEQQDAYDKAVATLKRLGISTDFANNAANGADSTGTDALNNSLEGNLDANKVPEPQRSILIRAAAKWKTDPGGVAALFLTEQNGFWAAYAEYGGKGKAAYTGITPNDPAWKLSAFGSTGQWAVGAGKFRGPFQFGPIWESKYRQDGDGNGTEDVNSFADAAFGAAEYMADLGAKPGDKASIANAARQYNGQVSWSPGGSSIRNPDSGKFARVQDLYGYQAGELAAALSGGDTSGRAALQACSEANQAVILQNVGPVSAQRKAVLDAAQTQIGVRYSWGGGDLNGPTVGTTYGCTAACYANNDPSTPGWDCSAFVRYAVYKGTGFEIPRTSEQQYLAMGAVSAYSKTASNIEPGDLVFWHGHVAMFVGGGKVIEAPQSGLSVRVADMRSNPRGYGDPFALAA